MKRIVIIGSCGSGKTTLGRHLAKNLGYPITDLDDLYWLPNWTLRPKEDFSSLIEKAISTDGWIICGNQSKYRHLIWPKADTIIWLDLFLPILLYRVTCRSLHRIIDKKPICNGNYETLGRFFSSHSIVLWVLKTYFLHRRDYKDERKHRCSIKWIATRWPKKFHFLDPHY